MKILIGIGLMIVACFILPMAVFKTFLGIAVFLVGAALLIEQIDVEFGKS
jgi:hypothetical protein